MQNAAHLHLLCMFSSKSHGHGIASRPYIRYFAAHDQKSQGNGVQYTSRDLPSVTVAVAAAKCIKLTGAAGSILCSIGKLGAW